jgi:hypothetical protein
MAEEEQSRQSAHGTGIAQAYGPGASATVIIGLTPEQQAQDENRRDMLGTVRTRVDELLEKTVNEDGEIGAWFCRSTGCAN